MSEQPSTDTSRSDDSHDSPQVTDAEPKKKKKKLGLIIAGVLIGLYAVLIVAAIVFQEPAPEATPAELAEQYTASIVTAHNELLSVDLEGQLNPGEKLGSVKKSFAANELDKRIKIMRTNAQSLLDLQEAEGTEVVPEELGAFATYILNEWVPFWVDVEAQIKEVTTTDEAFILWDELKAKLTDGDEGAQMEESFRSMTRVGRDLGWAKESITARIR